MFTRKETKSDCEPDRFKFEIIFVTFFADRLSTMKSEFSIAVIVTHHNRVDMCLRCLKSISSQTQSPSQVILIDDASTESITELKEYSRERGWVVIQNKQNMFVGFCRQTALASVTASHVVFIDDDDWFYPDALAHFREKIEDNPSEPHSFWLDVLHADGSWKPQEKTRQGRSTDINDFLENLVSIHATIVPTSVLRNVVFVHSLRYYVDIGVWLQVHMEIGAWNYHGLVVGVYNRSGQPSITSFSKKNYHARIHTFKTFIEQFDSKEVLAWSHSRMIDAYFCLGADSCKNPSSIFELLKSYIFLIRQKNFQKSRLVAVTLPKMLMRLPRTFFGD